MAVNRLAPGDQRIQADFGLTGSCDRILAQILTSDGICRQSRELPPDCRSVCFQDLGNGTEYRLRLTAVRGSTPAALAPERLFRCGWAPGVVVNYIHPDDHTFMPSGRSPASPSLLRLASGRLLASHDVFWGGCAQNHSLVFYSDDQGASWRYLSSLRPCFWGKLFRRRETVYMLGMGGEYGALQLFRSPDGGATWSEPVVLLPGGSSAAGGPHKAPMPVAEWAGRLWTAIDYGSWALGGHASGMISAAADADLMQPANWICTGFLPYDPDWPGTSKGKSAGCLEGNAVVSPDGRLFNLLRYQTVGCRPEYGRAILLEADPAKPEALLKFHAVIDFPGNLSKFKVGFDPVSSRYYSLVSRVTTGFIQQRNVLSLTSSLDLHTWRIERDILNYADNGWPEPVDKVGFQYADWIFAGPDLLALSRTAINGAYNYHNANQITAHRIVNFRA